MPKEAQRKKRGTANTFLIECNTMEKEHETQMNALVTQFYFESVQKRASDMIELR